jgi:hypothetical protein
MVSATSNASRVAAMFRSRNGSSFCGSDGRTWNCQTIPGHSAPSRIAESTSSPRPIDGSSQVRRKTLAKNSSAQISAMNMRMFFDGRTALNAV